MKKLTSLLACFLFLLSIGWVDAKVGSNPVAAGPNFSIPTTTINPISGLPHPAKNITLYNQPTNTTLTGWVKHPANPIMSPGLSGSWDSSGVNVPSVLFKDGNYMMWYSGNSGAWSSTRIGQANSEDGIHWTQSTSNPVLLPGPAGSWDSEFVMTPGVIFQDGIYKMWYRGSNNPNGSGGDGIGYATSTNGVNWTKYAGNPVLTVGAAGSWDSGAIWSANVIEDGTTYRMWYTGMDLVYFRVGYATSSDGIHWSKYASNPVLNIGSPPSCLDCNAVYYPHVINTGNSYQMWYSASNGGQNTIGRATSPDGLVWSKDSANPVLTPGAVGSWDNSYVVSSMVIEQSGNYQMWYTGANAQHTEQIGYAALSASCYTLTTSVVPPTSGTVTADPAPNCPEDNAKYSSGTNVAFTPHPASGYNFHHWSGDASGNADPVNVTMNSIKNVIANFKAISQEKKFFLPMIVK